MKRGFKPKTIYTLSLNLKVVINMNLNKKTGESLELGIKEVKGYESMNSGVIFVPKKYVGYMVYVTVQGAYNE